MEATLLHELAMIAAGRDPAATAVTEGKRSIDYGTLAQSVVDFSARVLVTSSDRLAVLGEALERCDELRHVVVVDNGDVPQSGARYAIHRWEDLRAAALPGHRVIDVDMAAIL